MKQRTAGHQDNPDAMTRRMAAAIMNADPATLFIVPSTRETLGASAGWVSEAKCCVIGLREDFGSPCEEAFEVLSPARFLAACRSASVTEPRLPVMVFTDQFVSAEHAPLFVRQGADEMFFPSLELVAAAQYGYSVSYWDGADFARPVRHAPDSSTDVLRALHRYYRACDALGEAWLMRERQHQRTVAGRVEAARLRLRLYQSIVMLATVGETSAQAQLLEEFMALQHRLPAGAAS